ncbi:MAG: hypothetical protein A2901_08500 [Elusimicrobia bacterium RIFCSPLOWO2_01_FULL_54_10]|nr:MAG: hypothetical protein A2901_08500 [Elusimicrobia bacterium RIFCSPLOWO2_01_FULL_54_10]
METSKYTEDIVSQWRETWSAKKLQDLIASCENDEVGLPYFLKHFSKEGKILECGCGLGQWLVYLQTLGYQTAGVEIVPDCIAVHKRYYPDSEIEVGDVRSLPFPDNAFAGYISIGVLEHMIEGPRETLAEMKRVLRPGGTAVITVPAFNYFLRAWYPIRQILVDLVKYNPWARRAMGKSPLLKNTRKTDAELQELKSQLLPQFWPSIRIDPDKGPLFIEYKVKRGAIENYLNDLDLEIVEVAPIFHPYVFSDVCGKVFFANPGSDVESPRLNIPGRALNAIFKFLSPHFFNYLYLYVVRKKGKYSSKA